MDEATKAKYKRRLELHKRYRDLMASKAKTNKKPIKYSDALKGK